MLDKKVVKLLTEQVNKELFSAYLYLDISNYYAAANLNGFANWFMVQTQEEMSHAKLFMEYILNNGESVELAEIKAPDMDYKDYLKPLEESFKHEQFVTASINNIYDVCQKAKDYRTIQFLEWFIKEQGEEEKNADELINKFKLFAGDGKGLYMLDSELTSRVYSPPSLVL